MAESPTLGVRTYSAYSIDETETGSEMGGYVYQVNLDDATEETMSSGSSGSSEGCTEITRRLSKRAIKQGMFYRRFAAPAATQPSKNNVGQLKEQFESQNVILAGSMQPKEKDSGENVGQLKNMFETKTSALDDARIQDDNTRDIEDDQGTITPDEDILNNDFTDDIMDNENDGVNDIKFYVDDDDLPIEGKRDDVDNTAIIPLPPKPRYNPASLRHLGHLKVTAVDFVPEQNIDPEREENLQKLKKELANHMNHLSVPAPVQKQPIIDEDDDREPIYV